MINSEFVSFLDAQNEAYIVCDTQYHILASNTAFKKLNHYSENVIGQTCFHVSHGYNAPCNKMGEACPLSHCHRSGKTERTVHLHHTPTGEEYVSIEVIPLKDRQNKISGFVEKIEPLKRSKGTQPFNQICGHSTAFNQMMHLIKSCAQTDINVLISGEHGTGKERVAQTIHHASRRASKPFISIDCASLTENNYAIEIFGSEKNTSLATTQSKGIIDAVEGGTLYIDEICDLPLTLQSSLISFLQTRSFKRVGSNSSHFSDFRIIASTTRSIIDMIHEGTFRSALYYRMNTFPINVLPLRERKEDIPDITQALIKRYGHNSKLQISEDAMSQLMQYDYPGNIRELVNFIERATLLCDSDVIKPEHLLIPQQTKNGRNSEDSSLLAIASTFSGNRQELAKLLGISERTLYRKLAQLTNEKN